jgi:phage shock protein PspC (stress-responsive transcriptional regulator)
MKKTVTANIGGINFFIEETAYEKLNRYLEQIASYFENDSDEVIEDIESRIAELFREMKPNPNQVITNEEVTQVMAIMGSPEVISGESEEDGQEHSKSTMEGPGVERKFFRDRTDRVISGVCSGIAAYFNWDVTWVRIIFLLLLLTYGTSFWIYIIIWIITLEAKTKADKLRMRGKAVTLENIKSMADELANDVKDFANSKNAKKAKKKSRWFSK